MEIKPYFVKTVLIALFLLNRSLTSNHHNKTKMDVFVINTQGISCPYLGISNSHTHTYLE
jgi:hypothetical protein